MIGFKMTRYENPFDVDKQSGLLGWLPLSAKNIITNKGISTQKGVAAVIVNLFQKEYPDLATPKHVFPARNFDEISLRIEEGLNQRYSVGIATATESSYSPASSFNLGFERGIYWVIFENGRLKEKNLSATDLFLRGDKDWGYFGERYKHPQARHEHEWLEEGYVESLRKDKSIKETIVNWHPANYAEDDNNHYVARIKPHGQGNLLVEMSFKTWNFRNLEEKGVYGQNMASFILPISLSFGTEASFWDFSNPDKFLDQIKYQKEKRGVFSGDNGRSMLSFVSWLRENHEALEALLDVINNGQFPELEAHLEFIFTNRDGVRLWEIREKQRIKPKSVNDSSYVKYLLTSLPSFTA